MNTYRKIEMQIIQWSEDRKIIPNAKPQSQLNKALEEMAELFRDHSNGNIDGIKDSIGDVMVCLINYCALMDIDIVDCMALAFDQIKDRTGTMLPDGTFVKD